MIIDATGYIYLVHGYSSLSNESISNMWSWRYSKSLGPYVQPGVATGLEARPEFGDDGYWGWESRKVAAEGVMVILDGETINWEP